MNNQEQAKYIERILKDRVIGKPVHVEDATMAGDWSRIVVKNSATGLCVAHVIVAELMKKPCVLDAFNELVKQVEGASH